MANEATIICGCGLDAKLYPDSLSGSKFYACQKIPGDPTRCSFFVYTVNEAYGVVEDKDGEFVDTTPLCKCNLTCSTFTVKKESVNKGRVFYCCGLPIKHPQRCTFFQLQGEAPRDDLPLAPLGCLCICGKTPSMGTKKNAGVNCGRKFYRCTDKKCAYFVWL